ncbi:MAG: hypothetical protein PF447_09795 [Spirochaetaceae bacterium]|jgi:hypothetical protein|nr:hypothetical protein [Spirochaetaceae bacterium]
MNTTAITFERNNLEYTFMSGNQEDRSLLKPSGLSILLMNRGDKPFRKDLLHQLSQLGTREIISVETSKNRINPEELQRELPLVKLLFFQSKAHWGEMINIGIKESLGEFVFLIWNDMDINSYSISSRVFSKIEERQDFCTLPWLYDQKGELYPSRFLPSYGKDKQLKMLPLPPEEELPRSLFPLDYVGIYQRDKFLRAGGYDGNIKSSYWQLMDLGFRAAMGNQRIAFHSALKVHCKEEIPSLNISVDQDYIQFYLKTLALKIRNGQARLPISHLFSLWFKTPLSFRQSVSRIKEIRRWVKAKQYHFCFEAMDLINHWGDL